MAVLLGRTSAGSGTSDFIANGDTAVWSFVASASGQLKYIFVQTQNANATVTAIDAGIYDDVAGTPTNRLGFALADSLAAARGAGVWRVTLATPVTIVSGTTYWLGIHGGTANFTFKGDAVAATYRETTGVSDFPNPLGATSNGGTTIIIWGEDSGAFVDYDQPVFWTELGPGEDFGPNPFYEDVFIPPAAGTAWLQPLSDTITLSDALVKSPASKQSDTITLSDVATRTVQFVRAPADTITLSDALAKAVTHSQSDTITLSDAVAKSMVLAKADTITLSDAIVKAFGSNRADTITLSDALVKNMGIIKSDTITLSDIITPILNPGGGSNFTLNLADSIVLTEAIAKSMAVSKADQITLADSIVEALNGVWITGTAARRLHNIIMSRFGIY